MNAQYHSVRDGIYDFLTIPLFPEDEWASYVGSMEEREVPARIKIHRMENAGSAGMTVWL